MLIPKSSNENKEFRFPEEEFRFPEEEFGFPEEELGFSEEELLVEAILNRNANDVALILSDNISLYNANLLKYLNDEKKRELGINPAYNYHIPPLMLSALILDLQDKTIKYSPLLMACYDGNSEEAKKAAEETKKQFEKAEINIPCVNNIHTTWEQKVADEQLVKKSVEETNELEEEITQLHQEKKQELERFKENINKKNEEIARELKQAQECIELREKLASDLEETHKEILEPIELSVRELGVKEENLSNVCDDLKSKLDTLKKERKERREKIEEKISEARESRVHVVDSRNDPANGGQFLDQQNEEKLEKYYPLFIYRNDQNKDKDVKKSEKKEKKEFPQNTLSQWGKFKGMFPKSKHRKLGDKYDAAVQAVMQEFSEERMAILLASKKNHEGSISLQIMMSNSLVFCEQESVDKDTQELRLEIQGEIRTNGFTIDSGEELSQLEVAAYSGNVVLLERSTKLVKPPFKGEEIKIFYSLVDGCIKKVEGNKNDVFTNKKEVLNILAKIKQKCNEIADIDESITAGFIPKKYKDSYPGDPFKAEIDEVSHEIELAEKELKTIKQERERLADKKNKIQSNYKEQCFELTDCRNKINDNILKLQAYQNGTLQKGRELALQQSSEWEGLFQQGQQEVKGYKTTLNEIKAELETKYPTVETAEKAKRSNEENFLAFSSMSVIPGRNPEAEKRERSAAFNVRNMEKKHEAELAGIDNKENLVKSAWETFKNEPSSDNKKALDSAYEQYKLEVTRHSTPARLIEQKSMHECTGEKNREYNEVIQKYEQKQNDEKAKAREEQTNLSNIHQSKNVVTASLPERRSEAINKEGQPARLPKRKIFNLDQMRKAKKNKEENGDKVGEHVSFLPNNSISHKNSNGEQGQEAVRTKQ